MRAAERIAILSAIALMLLPFVHADFPYSAQWLNYADMRIVYQIDTSNITSNTANIYVTVSIDPTTLQNYINKWASYCDPEGKYDWFWPTFTYASTANQSERMLQIVEYNNFQTFTVGTCGTVSLPTQFTILLPNGVLDGGTNYATYQHYIYAYLKYPYVDDFSDNPVGAYPEEYNNYTGALTAGVVKFDSTFGRGHYFYLVNTSPYRRRLGISVNLSDNTPTIVCMSGSGYDYVDMIFVINGFTYTVHRNSYCNDIEDVLRSKGLSGTVTVDAIDVKGGTYSIYDPMNLYYWWIIPESIYRQITYGS